MRLLGGNRRTADVISSSEWANAARLVERLPAEVRQWRVQRGLSLRAAANEIGIPFTTLANVEQGTDVRASNAVVLLRWLSSGEADR